MEDLYREALTKKEHLSEYEGKGGFGGEERREENIGVI